MAIYAVNVPMRALGSVVHGEPLYANNTLWLLHVVVVVVVVVVGAISRCHVHAQKLLQSGRQQQELIRTNLAMPDVSQIRQWCLSFVCRFGGRASTYQ